MKKINCFIICLFVLFQLKAQFRPNDTTYFHNGKIKSIKYKNDEQFGGFSCIRYFKKSLNPLDINNPLIDTVYSNNMANKEDWTYYNGSTRVFLHNKTNVFIEKHTNYGYRKDSVYFMLRGAYHYRFRELNDLELDITYDRDSNISFLYLFIHDTLKFGYGSKEDFVLNRYSSKMRMDTGIGNYSYSCGKYGSVSLGFSNGNLLNKFYFFSADNNEPTTYYEFYNNFYCKKYGHYYLGFYPVGEWYEYYENGNISCIGNYEIYDNKSLKGHRKVGLWQYFDKDGGLQKKEKWKNGTILK